jgi:hypothetical protein
MRGLRTCATKASIRDMPLPIAPVVWNDDAARCATCGRALDAELFVVDQQQKHWHGRAVCRACKPAVAWHGDAVEWRSFACVVCHRSVYFHQGRGYRSCSYRCARTLWTREATSRRSAARAAHHYKQLTCEVCDTPFIATRRDARTCSAACRQRAWREQGPSLASADRMKRGDPCAGCGCRRGVNFVKGQCWACYQRAWRAARRHKQRPCSVCGQMFDTTRTDARFCSNACRQKDYRFCHVSRRLTRRAACIF